MPGNPRHSSQYTHQIVTNAWEKSLVDLLQLGRVVLGLMIGYLMIIVVKKP